MIPAQRQQIILNTLAEREVVSIVELTEILEVSHMTIRRDIQQLENDGNVVLISGGVRLVESLESEPSRKVKAASQSHEKALIAKAGAKLVPPNATVYLDAGTTCLALAVQLAVRDDITILTNDFVIATYLIEHSQCELYHTGGQVLRKNESCVGESTARFIISLNIDIAFISASSWDLHYISTPTESKVPVKKALVDASSKCVLITDATKYGKVAFFKAIPLASIDCVLSDAHLPLHVREALCSLGLEVVLASS